MGFALFRVLWPAKGDIFVMVTVGGEFLALFCPFFFLLFHSSGLLSSSFFSFFLLDLERVAIVDMVISMSGRACVREVESSRSW